MRFVVIGAGAWGTAFAVHLARGGHDVVLAPRRAEQAAALTQARENLEYLPSISLPPSVRITADLRVALAGVDVVMLACPAQALRVTTERLRDSLPAREQPVAVVSLVKGLELGTHLRPSEVVAGLLPQVVVGSLTGPTNAKEVAEAQPSAMLLATGAAPPVAREMQQAISSATLRVYTTEDLVGAEIGGCLKNVYAIAAGCCDGLKLGDNTKAALLTRALAEMVRVGVTLGGQPETFYGLSGFGDLIATCYGGWSRNREFGQRVGEGFSVAEVLANRTTVVEGYKTTEAFASLCAARGLEAPILQQMHAILVQGKKPAAALATLMTRELKAESAVL